MKKFINDLDTLLHDIFDLMKIADARFKNSEYFGDSEAMEALENPEKFEDYLILDNDCKELINNWGWNGLIFSVGLLKLLDSALENLDDESYKQNIFNKVKADFLKENLANDEFTKALDSLEKWGANKTFNIANLADFNSSIYNHDDLDEHVFNDDFPKLEKDLRLLSILFISFFNEFVLEIFNNSPLLDLFFQLEKRFELSFLLLELNNINISEKYFTSVETFTNAVLEFIDELKSYTSSILIEDDFKNLGKTQLFREDCSYIDEFLLQLLFYNTNMEKKSKFTIYNPCCNNINLVKKSFAYVKSKKSNSDVKFYGKLYFECSLFDTAKIIMYSFYQENIALSLSQEPGIPFNDVKLEEIDFIVSDHRNKSISEDMGYIHQFQDKLNYHSKMAILIKKYELYNKSINWMIKNDNLEAVICLEDCFILIANSNKSMKRENKFILIDYDLFLNYEAPDTGIIEIPIEVKRTIRRYTKDLAKKAYLEEILRIYEEFIDTPFSKVIDNEEVTKDFVYDELDKYWGDYYNNPLDRLLSVYPLVPYDFSSWFSEELKNIPNDVLSKSKQYNEQVTIKNFNFNEYFLLLYNINPNDDVVSKNIDFYTKDFNYEDLMYDKKRKIAPKIKQKSVEDGKSKIFEEKIDYVPLHSIITFDSNEIDEINISKRTVERYGDIFFVNSDKFLKKFLEIYLISGRAQEEYNYFLKRRKTLVLEFSYKKDFIYIRIPLIDIETQEKIIKAYELNEEHYNLVKQSRDNFRKDILNYENVLKDMDNFNKMEIDIKTGQIVEMSTVKRHMFDGLLWPLSISYLNAVHGTHVSNPNEKLDFYLKLFEFLTAFIDIVLISSIPEEDYSDFKHELWNGVSENKYYEATFGTWTKIYSKLLNFYSENNIRPKFNNDLIESLLDENIYKIMDEAREIRNEFPGHGTSIHESRAKQLIDDLKLKIDVVYDVFRYLTGFKLFYSVKVLELFEDGSNLYEVVSLNGPCDQPIYGEVTFKKRLKNNSLYLNNSFDGDLLELNKNLIIFEEVIEDYVDKKGQKKQRATGRFYLYLFNGFKKKKNKVQMRYKCYQIETDEIRKNVSFNDWKEFM